MSGGELRIEPATAGRWDDLVDLFGTRGDPAHCWCQFFRRAGGDWDYADTDGNREALRSEVTEVTEATEGGRAPGLIAYAGERPVGWVALAPRPSYPRLTASRGLASVSGADLEDPRVWSVTCFVVRVGWRRRGVAAALLDGAVGYARSQGAAVLEAQPVDLTARQGTIPSAELYRGVASTFAAAGFAVVGHTSAARPVMRRRLAG